MCKCEKLQIFLESFKVLKRTKNKALQLTTIHAYKLGIGVYKYLKIEAKYLPFFLNLITVFALVDEKKITFNPVVNNSMNDNRYF